MRDLRVVVEIAEVLNGHRFDAGSLELGRDLVADVRAGPRFDVGACDCVQACELARQKFAGAISHDERHSTRIFRMIERRCVPTILRTSPLEMVARAPRERIEHTARCQPR